MQRPARYGGRLLSKLGRGLSDFCALFFLERWRGLALPSRPANTVSPTAVAPFRPSTRRREHRREASWLGGAKTHHCREITDTAHKHEQQRLRRDERAIGGLDRAAAFHQQYLAQSQQYRAPAGEPTARETSPIPEVTSYDARSYHSHSSASGSSGFFQGPY